MEIPISLLDGKIRASTIEINSDIYSNLTAVKAYYKLPRFGNRNKYSCEIMHECRKLNSEECKVHSLGWGDPNCKTYGVMYLVVPSCGIRYFSI